MRELKVKDLTTIGVSAMQLYYGINTREEYPKWVAWKGQDMQTKEYGDTAEEAVLKLCEKLGII